MLDFKSKFLLSTLITNGQTRFRKDIGTKSSKEHQQAKS